MTKEEMKEYDHLNYLKGERKDSIEILKQMNEGDDEYFDEKINHSRGLKRITWMEIKFENRKRRESKIAELEHEINVINRRLAELKGEKE